MIIDMDALDDGIVGRHGPGSCVEQPAKQGPWLITKETWGKQWQRRRFSRDELGYASKVQTFNECRKQHSQEHSTDLANLFRFWQDLARFGVGVRACRVL